MPGRRRSKRRLPTVIPSFFCMFETTGLGLILRLPIRGLVQDTGGFPECANGRRALAGSWKSGANTERERKSSWLFQRQLLTANPNRVADFGSGERRLENPMGSSPKTGTSPTVIRVLSVDDHALIREGVAALIANQKDMSLVGEASNGREAIEQFRSHRPDVTLMDLQMPEMNGIDSLIAIRSEFPDARIIVLTTYAGDVLCKRAMKAGAQAYILKGNVRKDLLDTIRAVRAGKKFIHAEVAAELASRAGDDSLSEREIEGLSLIAAGNSNKLVADQLAISEDTVKGHVKNILSKLGVNDRTHAVTAALKRGIIEL